MKAVRPSDITPNFSLFAADQNLLFDDKQRREALSQLDWLTSNFESLRAEFSDDVQHAARSSQPAQESPECIDVLNNPAGCQGTADPTLHWVEHVMKQDPNYTIRSLERALQLSNKNALLDLKSNYGSLMAFLNLKKKSFFNKESNHHGAVGSGTLSHASSFSSSNLSSHCGRLGVEVGDGDGGLADELTRSVVDEVAGILARAPGGALRAVELANAVRAAVGPEALAGARELHGGLLLLLEGFPGRFRVRRAPKNDVVELVAPPAPSDAARPAAAGRRKSSLASSDLSGNSAAGGGLLANATRCLHIGNIPAHMSECALRHSIEQHAPVQSLKVVARKGHRFAFVNFATAEAAFRVKVCLSKQRLWRSAISFAKRESFEMMGSHTPQGHQHGRPPAPHPLAMPAGVAHVVAYHQQPPPPQYAQPHSSYVPQPFYEGQTQHQSSSMHGPPYLTNFKRAPPPNWRPHAGSHSRVLAAPAATVQSYPALVPLPMRPGQQYVLLSPHEAGGLPGQPPPPCSQDTRRNAHFAQVSPPTMNNQQPRHVVERSKEAVGVFPSALVDFLTRQKDGCRQGPSPSWARNLRADWAFIKATTDAVMAQPTQQLSLPALSKGMAQQLQVEGHQQWSVDPDALAIVLRTYPQFFRICSGGNVCLADGPEECAPCN